MALVDCVACKGKGGQSKGERHVCDRRPFPFFQRRYQCVEMKWHRDIAREDRFGVDRRFSPVEPRRPLTMGMCMSGMTSGDVLDACREVTSTTCIV